MDDSSKKIGPRQPSRDPNFTPAYVAGGAAAAEECGSSNKSKKSVPAPPLRSPPESRPDKKAEPIRKDVDLASTAMAGSGGPQ